MRALHAPSGLVLRVVGHQLDTPRRELELLIEPLSWVLWVRARHQRRPWPHDRGLWGRWAAAAVCSTTGDQGRYMETWSHKEARLVGAGLAAEERLPSTVLASQREPHAVRRAPTMHQSTTPAPHAAHPRAALGPLPPSRSLRWCSLSLPSSRARPRRVAVAVADAIGALTRYCRLGPPHASAAGGSPHHRGPVDHCSRPYSPLPKLNSAPSAVSASE